TFHTIAAASPACDDVVPGRSDRPTAPQQRHVDDAPTGRLADIDSVGDAAPPNHVAALPRIRIATAKPSCLDSSFTLNRPMTAQPSADRVLFLRRIAVGRDGPAPAFPHAHSRAYSTVEGPNRVQSACPAWSRWPARPASIASAHHR